MNTILLLLLVGIAFVFFLSLSRSTGESSKSLGSTSARPYVSKHPLTQTELIFYNRLIEATPEFVVLAQVQLSSFIKVDQTQIVRQDFYKWFTPISQQSVDFLICRKDFSIIAAIELDDKSHLNLNAIERDNKKNTNLAAAKVPLIRWHAEDMPLIEEIRRELLKYTEVAEVKIKTEEEWITDDQETFFRRSNTNALHASNSIKIVFGLLFIGYFIWAISHKFIPYKALTIFPVPTQTTTTQPVTTNSALNDLLEKQKQDQAIRDETTRQSHIAELEIIKKQEQQKLLEAQAKVTKEEMWKRYYKKSPQCEALVDVVACGNEYITNRNKFEIYWENQKTKLGY